MFRSSLFVGFPNHVIPVHNIKAVGDSVYYTIGKMLSTCIIQGGEVPVCLTKAVADYLVFDRVCSPVCLEDIPDQFREFFVVHSWLNGTRCRDDVNVLWCRSDLVRSSLFVGFPNHVIPVHNTKAPKTSQTRSERHHNTFTSSLHLVPFSQLCTTENSLHIH